MKLLSFNNPVKSKFRVTKTGPAASNILSKLKTISKKNYCGLTAIGEYLVDTITMESSIEEAEKTLNYHDRPGGSPANTAINFFKLGMVSNLVAKIGHDFNGKFLLKQLQRETFPTDGIVKDYNSGTSRVLIASGFDENYDLTRMDRRSDANLQYKEINKKVVRNSFCLTSGIFSIEYPKTREAILKIFKRYHNGDKLILIDPDFNGYRRFRGFTDKKEKNFNTQFCLEIDKTPQKNPEEIKKIDQTLNKYFSYADIITPSRADARRYLGAKVVNKMTDLEIMKKYYELSNKALVILTLGKNGTLIYDGVNTIHVPGNKVVKVRSTTGAGDAFKAGFLAGLERSETYEDIIFSVALGNVAGSFAVMHYGSWIRFKGLGQWLELGKQLFEKAKKVN
jgi:sugar/nucleoside kinase (ribokinase family)